MKILIIPALAVFLLAGCAQKWQKPGASVQDFENAYYNCAELSNTRFPAWYRSVTDETHLAAPLPVTRCEGNNPSIICLPVPCNYVFPLMTPYCAFVPTTGPSDITEGIRLATFRSCLNKNGWQKVD